MALSRQGLHAVPCHVVQALVFVDIYSQCHGSSVRFISAGGSPKVQAAEAPLLRQGSYAAAAAQARERAAQQQLERDRLAAASEAARRAAAKKAVEQRVSCLNPVFAAKCRPSDQTLDVSVSVGLCHAQASVWLPLHDPRADAAHWQMPSAICHLPCLVQRHGALSGRVSCPACQLQADSAKELQAAKAAAQVGSYVQAAQGHSAESAGQRGVSKQAPSSLLPQQQGWRPSSSGLHAAPPGGGYVGRLLDEVSRAVHSVGKDTCPFLKAALASLGKCPLHAAAWLHVCCPVGLQHRTHENEMDGKTCTSHAAGQQIHQPCAAMQSSCSRAAIQTETLLQGSDSSSLPNSAEVRSHQHPTRGAVQQDTRATNA